MKMNPELCTETLSNVINDIIMQTKGLGIVASWWNALFDYCNS